MEQQTPSASTSPSTHQQHRRDHRQQPSGNSSSSGHQQPSSTTSQDPSSTTQDESLDDSVSFSEPSLRFPRPIGSAHLANWISTSDPDIMRITSHSTDDAGLAGSTYELISGAPDDTGFWSQDDTENDNDNECISESISSLDPNTDTLSDDDFTSVSAPHTSRHDAYMESVKTVTGHARTLMGTTLDGRPMPFGGYDEDDEEEECKNDEDDAAKAPEPESDEDQASSRSSLEYTQQSLQMPSINTPSRPESPPARVCNHNIPDKALREQPGTLEGVFLAARADFNKTKERLLQAVADGALSPRHPAFLILTALHIILISLVWHVAFVWLAPGAVNVASNTPSIPSAAIDTTQVAAAVTPTPPTPPAESLSSLLSGGADGSTVSLILREEDIGSYEWLWSGKKPNVSFAPMSCCDVLVLIGQEDLDAWAAHGCSPSLTATRDGRNIKLTTSKVKEGLLVGFPHRETYGVIDLTVDVPCKPSVRSVVKVRFAKASLDSLSNFLGQMSDIVVPIFEGEAHNEAPACRSAVASAHSAYRDAPTYMSDLRSYAASLYNDARSHYDQARSQFSGQKVMDEASDVLGHLWGSAKSSYSQVQAQLKASPRVDAARKTAQQLAINVQTNAQLDLLQAQISAKLAWLSILGRTEERDEYRRKADAYFNNKLEEAIRRQTEAKTESKAESKATGCAPESWWVYLDVRFE